MTRDCVTGLFYKCLPKRSWILASEKESRSARGTKNLGHKARLTVELAVNCDGSVKIPLFVVGKSANPKCFNKDGSHSVAGVHYNSQSNSWMNALLFQKWYDVAFITTVREAGITGPIALVLDNAEIHRLDMDKLAGDDVELIKLPANCTSLFQPLDQGAGSP